MSCKGGSVTQGGVHGCGVVIVAVEKEGCHVCVGGGSHTRGGMGVHPCARSCVTYQRVYLVPTHAYRHLHMISPLTENLVLTSAPAAKRLLTLWRVPAVLAQMRSVFLVSLALTAYSNGWVVILRMRQCPLCVDERAGDSKI